MGRAKGLLLSREGLPLIERTGRLFEVLGIPWVLVGVREEYAYLGRPALVDDPPFVGPLGGLRSLLHYVADGLAIAVACDMPYVSGALVERLIAATPGAPIVAPRRRDRWEPLFARFDARAVLPIADARSTRGQFSLQGLLDEARAERLPLTPDEEAMLDDWDTPLDMAIGDYPET